MLVCSLQSQEADFRVNLLSQQASKHVCVYSGTKPLGMNRPEQGKRFFFFSVRDVFNILLLRKGNNRGKCFERMPGRRQQVGFEQVSLCCLRRQKPSRCKVLVEAVPLGTGTRLSCHHHPPTIPLFSFRPSFQPIRLSHKTTLMPKPP